MSQIIVLVGLPASGKSTYIKECGYYDTHVRINLDMLKTRNREMQLLHTCLVNSIPCIIDNTNVTKKERQRYIEKAQEFDVPIDCFWKKSANVKICIERNKLRSKKVPDVAIYTKNKQFEEPTTDEGFNEVYEI